MQKKPNDYRQIIFLTVIFLIGLAMIFIPLVQQHQEIDADNNIYAMLAEEIKNQHVSQAVSTPQILPEEKAEQGQGVQAVQQNMSGSSSEGSPKPNTEDDDIPF